MKIKVIIPIYKSYFYSYERISFQRCLDVLKDYPIVLALPEDLDVTSLLNDYPELEMERFPVEYFSSLQGYNRLMLSPCFYERFLDAEYVLIYQLDAFVFRDDLMYWVDKSYDYIGAPWIATPRNNFFPFLNRFLRKTLTGKSNPREKIFYKVGNGGFSLRKTAKFYQIVNEKGTLIDEYLSQSKNDLFAIEDVFWSLKVPEIVSDFKIPDYKEAVSFAMDRKPDIAIKLNNGNLPFGCHGFNKPKVKDFWAPVIGQYYPEFLNKEVKKKILLDLRALDSLTCGFGQIALNYGRFFSCMKLEKIEFVFLVPDSFVGYFGDQVEYLRESKLTDKVLSSRYDLIHITHQQSKFKTLPNNVIKVFTIHDLNFLYEKSSIKAKKYLKKVRGLAKNAEVIVTISNFVAEEVRKHIDLTGKSLRVIYNGVERIDQTLDQKPDFVKENGRPFFFTIGQIRVKKNFHVLLDVMKAFPEYDLYIAGEDQRSYAQIIKKRIADEEINNVFVTGPIANKERVWLYKHCEAFLFPSKFEGFGLPVIEAMQFGKAVFSSPMTSLTEICGGHAFMWEDDFNTEKMVKVIKDNLPGFYDNHERIEKIKEYAYSFSYERHIQEYLKLYEECLGIN